MASINRRWKEGMNAHCSAPNSVEKKGGDADEQAPWCSERERGRESADRRALLRSERGKGEVCGLSARSGPRHWAACARGAGEGQGAGPPRPKARGGRGGSGRPGFGGWARFG